MQAPAPHQDAECKENAAPALAASKCKCRGVILNKNANAKNANIYSYPGILRKDFVERLNGPFLRSHYPMESLHGTSLNEIDCYVTEARPAHAWAALMCGRVWIALSTMHDAGVMRGPPWEHLKCKCRPLSRIKMQNARRMQASGLHQNANAGLRPVHHPQCRMRICIS